MRILVTSIIDVDRAPNGRLHCFIEELSRRHHLTVVCPYDTWRPTQTDVDQYGSASRMADTRNVDVRYLTRRSISPIVQEVTSEGLLRMLDLDYGSYDVHLDYSTLFLGAAVGRRTRDAGIPTVYDLMDDVVAMVRDSPQLVRPLGSVGARVAEVVLGRNIEHAAHVTYTTEPLREAAGIPVETSTWIPNGVDLDRFTPDVAPALEARPDVEFVVGYVGTNREWVDLSIIVDAVARLRADGIPAGLLVVGEEGGLERVHRRVVEHGIGDSCSFVGTISHSEVPSYLRAMDAGVIPFTESEISEHSLPLKLFEYMAVGLPVVSSPLSGVRDVAADTVRFATDSVDFAEALATLYRDSDERNRLGQTGRELVEAEFSWRVQVDAVDEVLHEVTGQRRANERAEAIRR
jgi:glycosyltransferase involved in cell wall biosynthesis